MENKKRLVWIDALKFFACLFVFWGHFFEVFLHKIDNFTLIGQHTVDALMKSVINGNFWVSVFCIISGFICYSSMLSERGRCINYISYCLKRYIRFVIPLILTLCVIIGLKETVGFNTNNYENLLNGTWGGYYTETDFSFINCLKFVLLFQDNLDGPIWMLRPLILSNCFIVLTNCLVQHRNVNLKIVWISITCLATVLTIVVNITSCNGLKYSYCLDSCLTGACIRSFSSKIRTIRCRFISVITCFVVFIMLAGLHDFLFVNLLGIDAFKLKVYSIWNILYGAILVTVLYAGFKDYKTKNEILSKLAKISFFVFLLHWPIMCSIGPLVMNMTGSENYNIRVLAIFVVVNVLVIALSFFLDVINTLISVYIAEINHRKLVFRT